MFRYFRTLLSGVVVAGVVLTSAVSNSSAAQAVETLQPQTVSGVWIYNYKKPHATSHVQSYGKVRVCFNATGDHLYQGYALQVIQKIGAPLWRDKLLWSNVYWGPKHKTCSPWLSAGHDKVYAEITRVKSPQSHAAAQVWIYNP